MSGFQKAAEAEASASRCFNGRIFKLITKPEERKDTKIHPPPEYWRGPSTRNYNYDEFTDKSWGLGLSCTVKYVDILE